MMDIIGTITASRRTHEAAVSIRGAIVAVGDKQMIDGMRADLEARFCELATALGYLVSKDEPHSAEGAETAATAPAN